MKSENNGTKKTSRRDFVKTAAAGFAAMALFRNAKGEITMMPDGDPYPELVEVTISDLQAQMKAKKLTSRKLTEMYLERIKQIDTKTHSVLELNPDALAIADAMDKERKKGKVRGPMHGIPTTRCTRRPVRGHSMMLRRRNRTRASPPICERPVPS